MAGSSGTGLPARPRAATLQALCGTAMLAQALCGTALLARVDVARVEVDVGEGLVEVDEDAPDDAILAQTRGASEE